MTTMKVATARQPPMGPIKPPKESALSESRSGLFAISSTALCASAGTTGRTSAICSSPMFMVALGATVEVARTAGVANDPDLTVWGAEQMGVRWNGGGRFKVRYVHGV